VALRFALHHAVPDALAVEIDGVALRAFEIARQRRFLEHRRLVLMADRLHGLGRFDFELAPYVLQARVDILNLRVLLAVALGELRFLTLELGELALERLNLWILRDDRD